MNDVSFTRIFNYVKVNRKLGPVEQMLYLQGFDDVNAYYARCSDEEIMSQADLNYFIEKNWNEKITYNLIWKEARRRGLK